ncbi:acylamino-acid-releasing enzyme-like [Diadema antillarum]|uniref:acylamino-acid-releasing enzyme-like n=1 Tax=Diadema antillarum TaxID=105358 RepID=UPI003A83FFE4
MRMPIQAFPSAEKAAEVYRLCASAPSLSRASLHKTGDHIFSVHTTWSQRDLERVTNIKFGRTYLATITDASRDVTDVTDLGNNIELNSEQMVRWSPSGKLKAVLRAVKDKKGDEKQYLEVWNNLHKKHNINLTALDKHGKVADDGEFGCLEWSSDETRLLYVAEKKQAKASSYFEKPKDADPAGGTKDDSDSNKGDQFLYRQEWGELLTGRHWPVACILDLQTETVTVPDGQPAAVSAGQAVWTPDDSGIVFVGWQNEPYRVGLIYCSNRKGAIYHLDLENGVCKPISVTDQSVSSPRFNPDGSALVYLRNSCHGPHRKCEQLMVCEWSSKETRVGVDIVQSPTVANPFPGLYVASLGRGCWLDSETLIMSSMWRSSKAMITVNIRTGEVTRVTDDSQFRSWTFCDHLEGLVLAYRSSPVTSGQLVLGTLPRNGKATSPVWKPLHEACVNFSDLEWSVIQLQPQSKEGRDLDFEAIIMKPAADSSSPRKPPLIVWPHGGPHSAYAGDYFLFPTAFCRLGFVIALVNYRGSVGFGQASVDSLPGHVGTNDVQDVQTTAEEILKRGWADPEQVVVSGGSHGGFLSTHMIGQYPDFYKACVTRNPVTDIAAMFGVSDIPSWSMTETGHDFDYATPPSPEMLSRMFSSSPMAHVHKVKTPTLVMLGAVDLRVPPHQGRRFHEMLKARGVETRLLMYADNSHPISKVDAEADCFMNMYTWITAHL